MSHPIQVQMSQRPWYEKIQTFQTSLNNFESFQTFQTGLNHFESFQTFQTGLWRVLKHPCFPCVACPWASVFTFCCVSLNIPSVCLFVVCPCASIFPLVDCVSLSIRFPFLLCVLEHLLCFLLHAFKRQSSFLLRVLNLPLSLLFACQASVSLLFSFLKHPCFLSQRASIIH